MPEISIIVPVYNVEQYLERCIESILAQTFTDFELILVDDGSCDKSKDICNYYEKKDFRVKVISKSQEGVSRARNVGIEYAKGEFILFSDSDDYVEADWCEKLLKSIKDNKSDLGICGYWVCINEIKNSKVFRNDTVESLIQSNEFFELRKYHLLNCVWNKIFLNKIIKQYNIRFNENVEQGEDTLFVLKYISKIRNISIINEPLYNYIRYNSENLSNKYNNKLYEIYSSIFQELYNVSNSTHCEWKKYKEYYYTEYFKALLTVLDNTMKSNNRISFIKKIKYNNKILNNKMFSECLENANLSEYNEYYIGILRKKKYIYFYIFNKLFKIKNNIISYLRRATDGSK